MELSHKEKIRLAGVRKFGSEEAWREAQRQNGMMGAKTGKGGFHYMKANDPDKLKQVGDKGRQSRYGK